MPVTHFTPNNELTLLVCGAQFFPALIAELDQAQREILLETYIFALDETATAVKQALVRAAGRGVQVRLITDWHGTGPNTITELNLDFIPAGVEHRNFNPLFKRGASRSHRKLCVVDAHTAFIGGININDDQICDYDPDLRLPAPRWDFAVRVRGPLVNAIWVEASAQWQRLGALDWRGFLARQRKRLSAYTSMPVEATLASFIVRDNFRNRRTIQKAYLDAMHHAQRHIVLATPYFAPGRKFINAIAAAAQRKVKVTLLIGVGQFAIQDAVAHSFYPKLLKNGVHLVEYRKTQLHAKVAVVDDEWATVGSSNCDGLSLFLNQEANLVVKDAPFAKALKAEILQALSDGHVIKLSDYANLPWYKRAWYGGAFWAYKTLMRIATWGRYG